ncbi:MAG: hypothetical protein SNF33_06385 [Candidatus Algichlamydia australiensis]|nr:hypothetical protein [Chlamydiales bacterium]
MYIIALSLLCASLPELSYNEEIKGISVKTEWFTQKEESSLTLEGKSPKTNFKLVCDPDYIMSHVTYLSSKHDKDEQYECYREGKILKVKRVSGENESLKEYNIGNCNWIQEFNFGLRPFVRSGLGSFRFCIINPSDLSLNRMIAKKQHIELIKTGKETYRAQKVKITLQGPKALFWTAYAWFDTETGHMVKYKGNRGPNTPMSTVTLL